MTGPHPLRIGALLSGGGRTVTNLAEAIARERIPASIVAVIAHREELPGVARCRAAGLPVSVTHERPIAAAEIDRILTAAEVELVCLAGYLRKFPVHPRWTGRTINIHPALLPAFGGQGMYGDRVHAAVLASGVAESGCTVHVVDEEYDRGAILLQRRCPVRPDDTLASLAARVFAEERIALPEAVRRIAVGEIPLPIPGR
jgi:phosphoribosylglycinamide formyltransferase-1